MICSIVTFVLLVSVGVNIILFIITGLLVLLKIFFFRYRLSGRPASMLTAIVIVTSIQIISIGILLLIGETQ